MMEQVKKMDLADDKKLFVSKLKLILEGNRDMALVKDTGLYYMDAVELTLLLESLAT